MDACPDCVETARAVVKLAGLSDKVSFELGLSNVIVPGLAARYGTADVVFEDHCKECYARDLVAMEKAGLVVNGTWLVADNVLYPGAPDLLAALRDRERYAAALVPYKYEYDQVGHKHVCVHVRLDVITCLTHVCFVIWDPFNGLFLVAQCQSSWHLGVNSVGNGPNSYKFVFPRKQSGAVQILLSLIRKFGVRPYKVASCLASNTGLLMWPRKANSSDQNRVREHPGVN